MKFKIYAGVSDATGNRVMFYKKHDGQWRFCIAGGRWINGKPFLPKLYSECNYYLVNNFKEKQ